MARKKTTRKNLRSAPVFNDPQSRNEAILQNILGASNVLVDPQSRIEAILQAILYGTAYTAEPQSRMEELLLCILNGETTDMVPISRNEAILIAKINGDSYTEEPQSRIEELLIAWLNAYIEKTVTGNPITVNDAVAQNVMALLAELVPAQDLHGYSNPWPAGGGKNKWNPTEYNERSSTVNSVTLDGDTYTMIWANGAIVFNSKGKQSFPAGEYVVSMFGTNIDNIRFFAYADSDDSLIINGYRSGTAFTVNESFYLGFNGDYNNLGTAVFTVQLEIGSTATAYAPYSNICPITGNTGCTITRTDGDGQNPATVSVEFPAVGKNLFDESNADWVFGKYLNAEGEPTGHAGYKYTNAYTPVKANTAYAMQMNKVTSTQYALTLCEYDENKQFIKRNSIVSATTGTGVKSGTFTSTAETAYIRFSAPYMDSPAHYYGSYDFQLEEGSTATAYEPFTNTVYGGTVNFTTGTLTITKALITKNSANMNNSEDYPGWTNSGIRAIEGAGKSTGVSRKMNVGNQYAINTLGASNDIIYLPVSVYNKRQTEWKALAIDIQMIANYATPIEIQLPPQTLVMLMDKNIISSAEADSLSVTYKGWADTSTWAGVQKIVRSGRASEIFKVGDQFEVNVDGSPTMWDVIGIDVDTPYDTTKTHSLTLQMHDVYAQYAFDAREALFAFPNGLEAGTYHFTITADSWVSGDVGKTIQFTIVNDIPEGGQLCFSSTYNVTMVGALAQIYASPSNTTAQEEIAFAEGSDGTDLGNVSNAISGNINSLARAKLGNNRYSQSAVRQILNSLTSPYGWTPQSPWARPSDTTADGFMHRLDADFLAVLGESVQTTALNTLCDGGGSEQTHDKIFLVSRSQVFDTLENNINEGEQYPYYSIEANRVKYLNSTASAWRLRTPVTNYTHSVRITSNSGTLSSSYAQSGGYVAPAVTII